MISRSDGARPKVQQNTKTNREKCPSELLTILFALKKITSLAKFIPEDHFARVVKGLVRAWVTQVSYDKNIQSIFHSFI